MSTGHGSFSTCLATAHVRSASTSSHFRLHRGPSSLLFFLEDGSATLVQGLGCLRRDVAARAEAGVGVAPGTGARAGVATGSSAELPERAPWRVRTGRGWGHTRRGHKKGSKWRRWGGGMGFESMRIETKALSLSCFLRFFYLDPHEDMFLL